MKSSKTSSNLSSCINHCWEILKSSIIQKILREGLIFFWTKFHHFSWKAADFIFMLFFYFKTIFLNDIFFGIGSLITQISRYHNLKSCRFCIKFPLLFIVCFHLKILALIISQVCLFVTKLPLKTEIFRGSLHLLSRKGNVVLNIF